MKSFADRSFFTLFDEILRRDRPPNGPDLWSLAGTTWHRSRHTFETHGYGFTMETYEIERPARAAWSLLVARETWWAGRQGEIIRSAHWAKPVRGSRTAILAWFKEQQHRLNEERAGGDHDRTP